MRDNRRCTFSLEEELLWIMDSYFSLKWQFEVKNVLGYIHTWRLFWSCQRLFYIIILWSKPHFQKSIFLQLRASFQVEKKFIMIKNMFLSAVWTLVLTAPIHCRASIAETVIYTALQKFGNTTGKVWFWMISAEILIIFWCKYCTLK